MFELEDIVREPFPKIGIIAVGGAAVRGLCNLKNYSPSKVELIVVAVDTEHGELPTTDARSTSWIHCVEVPRLEGKADQTRHLTLAEDMTSMTENIKSLLSEADFVILASHLDSETEIRIMPVIASACRAMKVLTIGIVSSPSSAVDNSKQAQTLECIAELKEIVNSLIIIPSQKAFDCPLARSNEMEGSEFHECLMSEAIRALVEPLALPNLICVSFEDLKTAFDHSGICHFAFVSGNATGQAVEALRREIENAGLFADIQEDKGNVPSPSSLEGCNISPRLREGDEGAGDVSAFAIDFVRKYPLPGASAVWICIECGPERNLDEIGEVTDGIYKLVESDAFFVCSAVINMKFTDTIKIRMLAEGYGDY